MASPDTLHEQLLDEDEYDVDAHEVVNSTSTDPQNDDDIDDEPKTLGDIVKEFNDHGKDGSASVTSSVFNLTTTILGTGALIMPHVCRTVGIFLFMALVLVVASAANLAIKLLAKSIEMAKLKDAKYQLVGKAAYGRLGYQLAMWSIILQQLGACILYIQIIGQIIDPADLFSGTGNRVAENRIFWQLLIVICIIFPLSMLREMSALQYTSFLSVFFILAMVIFVFSNGADVISRRGGQDVSYFHIEADLFSVIPIVSFAFVCHMNVFPIYRQLKRRSVSRMVGVSRRSMGAAATLYFISGVFGYLTFINCTSENLVEDFRVTGTSISVIFDVIRMGYGLALIFAYPVLLFEMRHCIDELIFGDIAWSRKRQFFLNLGIIGFCTLLAILIKSIGTVFGFIGATSGSLLVYVMPSLFYLKLQKAPWTAKQNIAPLAMLICGSLLIPLCVTVVILRLVGVSAFVDVFPDTCGSSTSNCPGCDGTCVVTRGLNWTACV
eukprot:m.259988 g.259988  ORF g.259988 m.259988 type:complete len:495 (+) comp39014_c0_seq1:71-1555(+)